MPAAAIRRAASRATLIDPGMPRGPSVHLRLLLLDHRGRAILDPECREQVRTLDDQLPAQLDRLNWKLTYRKRSVCRAAADPERSRNDWIERERRWE